MTLATETHVARLLWALDEENRRLRCLLAAGYSLAAADEALAGRGPLARAGGHVDEGGGGAPRRKVIR